MKLMMMRRKDLSWRREDRWLFIHFFESSSTWLSSLSEPHDRARDRCRLDSIIVCSLALL